MKKIVSTSLLILFLLFISYSIYTMIIKKDGIDSPIWFQVILGLCFLLVGISNYQQKRYWVVITSIFGVIFVSASIIISV
ncbi:Uncharacterised protein [Listeria ivanovii subsp. londoniensis]|uniref:DUF3953 domain-containing protein n=1 Tax=Listeria ivanovii TaxID=1638 RepID=A0AAX2DLD8_LISIV|nr:hypothetical protein JL58_00605 [Listeria ivanovii subsp. londoniensis]MBM5608767.1 hypothetical protein [Listeria ivanovii]MBM5636927.1 hypothetical protein [Listeria ivanovii]MBM5706528.1 hypothetical protein [Listeria ivanovii]MBM5720052.1 hypothetical protein [Listeria ivanovii]